MVSENWLILCASDLPLEPRLRLPVVAYLQCSCPIANLWQVRHGVSDSDGSVDSTITSVERKLAYRECARYNYETRTNAVWSVYVTVKHYWRISYRPPPHLENKLWEQIHAKAQDNVAAPPQEQQPGLLPCVGSGPHHTGRPNEGGIVLVSSKADERNTDMSVSPNIRHRQVNLIHLCLPCQ